MDKRISILVFGGGALQMSIINKCKKRSLFTVVIDPDENAEAKKTADAFEVVGGNDFENTCNVVKKYKISGLITAATDKPLVMMARIAAKYDLPFYTVNTASISTDKFLMKQLFENESIPCAKGLLIDSIASIEKYPVIIKPRDNSGSRGVLFCADKNEAEKGVVVAMENSKMKTVLAEEFILGEEYSIETLHHNKQHSIIQFTKKITTKFPYNVEMGHIAPAPLNKDLKEKINAIIQHLSDVFQFKHCVSHTELKIHENKITIIETSPRLGGDYITSKLVPLSTGVDMEELLITMAIGGMPNDFQVITNRSVGIFYIQLPEGRISSIGNLEIFNEISYLKNFQFSLRINDRVPKITSSADRYGSFLIEAENYDDLLNKKQEILNLINSTIYVN